MDVIGGWIIVSISLLTLLGVLVALACGYGED